ncbi:hypothetical protein AB0I00_08545 [Streptomyces sp. NPDC050803]|uniref:hypothetical protein n=1 Tax=unclassified Streptomyces TaxID=2593676 RepID=UPI003425227A
MTHRDIALLLADAADEVEIGIAPTQAVLRGGRRRRARRWAVATATALVIAGSSGALAVAGLPSRDADRGASVATTPAVPTDLLKPASTALAVGREDGTDWSVVLELWATPQNVKEARAQLEAMEEYGTKPDGVQSASELVGKSAYFVGRTVGEQYGEIAQGAYEGKEALPLHLTAAVPLEPGSSGPDRLVVGQVAKSVGNVSCMWKDGTETHLQKTWEGDLADDDGSTIRSVEGAPFYWYVCLAPKDTEYKSVQSQVPPTASDAPRS